MSSWESGGFGGYGGGAYTFTGLVIEPGWTEHVLDGTDRISVQAYWSEDGSREPVPATWSSGDSALATMDSSGAAVARVPGEVGILARARDTEAYANLRIFLGPEAGWTGAMRLTSVSAGGAQTCGLSDEGMMYCWGRAPMDGGSLLLEPTLVSDQGEYESIGAGSDYICAVDSEGAAHCFGAQYLQEFFADSPVPVDGDIEFVPSSLSVWGHDGTACALTPSGEAYCWGAMLSTDQEMNSSLVPVSVGGGHRFSTVSVGVDHACGITLEGETRCWGVNYSGALGAGRTGPGSDEPLLVKGQPQT